MLDCNRNWTLHVEKTLAYIVLAVRNSINYFQLKFTVTQCVLTDFFIIENEALWNKAKELRTQLSRRYITSLFMLISSAERRWNILWSIRNGKPQTCVS
jgi:hypothetical protein